MHNPAPDPGLLERLKAQTRDLHARAERSGVMGRLLACKASATAYTALLQNLQALYAALEAAQLRLRDELRRHGVALPALERSRALADDLVVWSARAPAVASAPGEGGPLEAVTHTYCARLAQADLPVLLAHVYLRLLGDLHGGQILAALVQRQFALPEPGSAGAGVPGTAFYRFGDAATVNRLRGELRAQLGAVVLTGEQAGRMVAEARWGFAAHIELFEGIQRRWGGAAPPTT